MEEGRNVYANGVEGEGMNAVVRGGGRLVHIKDFVRILTLLRFPSLCFDLRGKVEGRKRKHGESYRHYV